MPTVGSVLKRAARSIRFGIRGRRGAFEHIFQSRYWGDGGSASGVGSSMAQTESIRRELPAIVERFGIRSMIDAPCGDLYWMADLLPVMDIDYLGGDIVPEVVAIAEARTDYPRARFMLLDIAETVFPQCDLWLCRDVLFHLSFSNIRRTLANFKRSNIKYLLVTSHTRPGIPNRNVATGDFRELDLLKPPFSLPADKILARFEDYADPFPPRDILLFAREDLPNMV